MQVTIINMDTEYQCSFFIVPGNGPALSQMPNSERLQLLRINCHTKNDRQNGKQIKKSRQVQNKQ